MNAINSFIKCCVIGYGRTYYFGRAHCQWINAAEGLKLTAVCARNPEQQQIAKNDFPWIEIYSDISSMLRSDIDLAVVVTPQYTHFEIVMQCLEAGKHVIVDKPMAIKAEETDIMINEAKKRGLMLAVFHNRRYDGNFLTIKEIIDQGIIGDVFHIEVAHAWFGHPGHTWHAKKEFCGNAMYEWGAHAIYWVLNLIPYRVKAVTGFSHKLVWLDEDAEDQMQGILLFENGAVADITFSRIDSIGKPLWRILGTHGSILDTGENAINGYGFDDKYRFDGPPESAGSLQLNTVEGRKITRQTIDYKKSMWETYYPNIADHLLRGLPLAVPIEEGRRDIAILNAIEKSALSGKSEKVQYEF